MPRKKLTDAELAARGSTVASTRRSAGKRAAQLKAIATSMERAARTSPPRPPLPQSKERWDELICSLPRFNPYALGQGYHFDVAAAAKAIEWIETHVIHLKGAKAGQFFVLEPWQRAVIANLFGWKRDVDQLRRFRECLILVAKKNGKSAVVMALTLYLFLSDDEPGADVYCAGAAQKQAKIIWGDCRLELVRIDPDEELAVRYQHSIVRADGGSLKPISADVETEDGFNPHGFILDELHRQPDDKLVNMARLSSRARAQPVLVYLTTADEDRKSVCNDIVQRARLVLENPGDAGKKGFDPRFLPVVYEADEKDDWTLPATWRKANPCLGVTIAEEEMAAECRLAQDNPALEADFKRYCLNLKTSTTTKWLPMSLWDPCGEPFDPKTLEGCECHAGLDLGETSDMTSLALFFPKTGHVLMHYWCPEQAAKIRDRANDPYYLRWSKAGLVTLTPGDWTDYEAVYAKCDDFRRRFKIRSCGIDPHNASQSMQELMKRGMDMVPMRQGWWTLNEPAKKLEWLLGMKQLRHGGHDVLRWNAQNVHARFGEKGEISLVKKERDKKIDGIFALVMAIGRAMVAAGEWTAPSEPFFITGDGSSPTPAAAAAAGQPAAGQPAAAAPVIGAPAAAAPKPPADPDSYDARLDRFLNDEE